MKKGFPNKFLLFRKLAKLKLPPNENAVLMVLFSFWSPYESIHPSHGKIGEEAELSARTVRRLLTKLKNKGLVNWTPGSTNWANQYVIDESLFSPLDVIVKPKELVIKPLVKKEKKDPEVFEITPEMFADEEGPEIIWDMDRIKEFGAWHLLEPINKKEIS